MTPAQLAVAAVLSALYAPGDALPPVHEAVVLASITYNEAQGEDVVCKSIVAQTIMNRHALSDQSVIEVATAPSQFAAHKPRVENVIDQRAMLHSAEAAIFIYSGLIQVPDWAMNVTHFHDVSITKPADWGDNIEPVGKHCNIIFYVEMG